MFEDKVRSIKTIRANLNSLYQRIEMSSSVPYDPYIPNQTTGEQSASRTAAIQAVSSIIQKGHST